MNSPATTCVCALLGTAPCANGGFQTHHVPADFPTIQRAIDAAGPLDEIIVAPGVYVERIDYMGKPLRLRSAAGPEVTVIDSLGLTDPSPTGFDGQVVHCENVLDSENLLEGFTITGGVGRSTQIAAGVYESVGGGLYIVDSEIMVRDCIIVGNSANTGGGASCDGGDVRFIDCVFAGNTAPEIEGAGGGIGGGLFSSDAVGTIVNCLFIDNTADDDGGGLSIGDGLTQVFNSVFSGNAAQDGGGGVHVGGMNPGVQLISCSFAGNVVTVAPSPAGGAIRLQQGNSVMTNSVVWGNGPDSIHVGGGASLQADFSNVEGGLAGPGNIDVNPLYVDPSSHNLRLQPASPCVDAGTPILFAVPPEALVDLEGNDRTLDGDLDLVAVTDMGAYEATGYLARNTTDGTIWNRIGTAIGAAIDGDAILVDALGFGLEPMIDYEGKAIALLSAGHVDQPAGGSYQVADDSSLAAAAGSDVTLAGDLDVLFGDRVELSGESINIAAAGSMSLGIASVVDVTAPSGVVNAGSVSLTGASLGVSGGILNDATGDLTGYGDIEANITNDNVATYLADTQVAGNYANNGTTTVQNGTLTIIGTLTDNGTIIGSVGGGAGVAGGLPVAAGDGMAVLGDYVAGAGASLVMPSADHVVTVAGHVAVAIDDSPRYDMAQAELRMVGLGETAQNLERMSTDIGADPAGLDRALPGSYPIGTLRIGPTPTVVDLVDAHDNDGMGQAVGEAVYVETLIVDAGATLNTGGSKVYYSNLVLDGAVDDVANLIEIPPPCLGDLNGDGNVAVSDLLELLASWGSCPGCTADLDGSGAVDVIDLLTLLAAWGDCLLP